MTDQRMSTAENIGTDELNPVSTQFDPLAALYTPAPSGIDVVAPLRNVQQYEEYQTSPQTFLQSQQERKERDAFKNAAKLKAIGESNRIQPVHEKPRIIKNVLTRMEHVTGPSGLLQSWVQSRRKVKVITRSFKSVRGTCSGFIVAFDKYLNLAMVDVDETYSSLWRDEEKPAAARKTRGMKKRQTVEDAKRKQADQVSETCNSGTSQASKTCDSSTSQASKTCDSSTNEVSKICDSSTSKVSKTHDSTSTSEVSTTCNSSTSRVSETCDSSISEVNKTRDSNPDEISQPCDFSGNQVGKTCDSSTSQVSKTCSPNVDQVICDAETELLRRRIECVRLVTASNIKHRHLKQVFIRGDNVVSISACL